MTVESPSILDQYRRVRLASAVIVEPLEPEDCCIQSMPDVSPLKWHLAHTTWFFETFVLKPGLPGYQTPDSRFESLFNSYYNSVGQQFARSERGFLSRPTFAEVLEYRQHVDDAMQTLLAGDPNPSLLNVVELGVHHEQQHQELMLMDIKHVFSRNPLDPVYRERDTEEATDLIQFDWVEFESSLVKIGHSGTDFCFDNETPEHQVYVEKFELANRLTTCGEYLEFINDGGYERPEFWLSEGWRVVKDCGWDAPLYWQLQGDQWSVFTLAGLKELNPSEPVCHVSYYEADAFARWSQCWLPQESYWETAARAKESKGGSFLESGHLHPQPGGASVDCGGLSQMFGDLWEWTRSPYIAYPGYRASRGALGEYNGKFMCNQMVLRGGCCATPESHFRLTYRNFYPAGARWPFTGIRLCRELGAD